MIGKLIKKYFKKEKEKLPNKYDAFLKIEKCIDSCTTNKQIGRPITNLITNFHRMYNDEYLYDLLYDLKILRIKAFQI